MISSAEQDRNVISSTLIPAHYRLLSLLDLPSSILGYDPSPDLPRVRYFTVEYYHPISDPHAKRRILYMPP